MTGRKATSSDDENGPSSVVLLLREFHFFTQPELVRAAEAAWHRSFADTDGSRHFVVQQKFVTFIKVGPHTIHVLHASRPYLGELTEVDLRTFLPEPERRDAWRSHRAWASLDYLGKTKDTDLKYAVLAKLAAELVSDNCTGVWVPEIRAFIPSNPALGGHLQRLASLRIPELN